MDPKGVMAELTGRIGGYSRGKGGSMHMFSREKNFFGGHGIVGASVSLGTGLAFSHKYREDGGICYCYFGDGATNQGQVYESFNMASLWKLPIIYVIENNKYGMGTSIERASATTDLYRRGESFGIPGVQVNGMNVLDVKAAADEVTAYVRGGNGPHVMEMKTYRYRGHSMSDPAKYRTKEEVSAVRKESDPLDNLRAHLLDNKLVDEAKLKEIDRQVKEVVNEAAEFAQQSPEPDPAELYTDVLVEA
jgi:pyruvate dehydrogenase E1 component alpha subunit